MAQSTILLPVSGLVPDPVAPPSLFVVAGRVKMLFDDTAAEKAGWTFRYPSDLDIAQAVALKLQGAMTSATTGGVVLGSSVYAYTPGDAHNIDTDSFDTENTATDTVPGVAKRLFELSITLTSRDNLAPGDFIHLVVRRVATDVADTATGDYELFAASLEYQVVEA